MREGRFKTQGSGNAQAKLDEQKVAFIREAHFEHGVKAIHLSRHFKVGRITISRVLHRRLWKHVP